ncbi:MAG: hypothetical protein ACRDY6_18555 [Acidimicrobiia bacterium]
MSVDSAEEARVDRDGALMKGWHLIACGTFVAAGVVLAAVGLDALALLPALGCAVMMGTMAWMTG